MTEFTKPGSGLIYMKVGTHAQESLEAIIKRKQQEIEEAGYALWGYGGNTCHPVRMVQPFAREYVKRDGVIYLCMQPMDSRHRAPPARAAEASSDGITWEPIPSSINVLGSRFALAIDDLRAEEFELALADTRVGIGNSQGRRGDLYVSRRVDKACLEITEPSSDPSDERRTVQIGLVGRLIEPFAVIVR